MTSLLLLVAKHAALLIAMLLTAAAAGTLVAGPRLSLALRSALGLAVCGHALFFLALLGQLRPAAIAVLVIVAIAGGAWRGLRLPKPARPTATALAGGALFAFIFLMALHPPLAFDETLYHLPFIRALAEGGELRFVSEFRFPVFPQLHELLCVPLFLAAGDTATHLVALVAMAITAALLLDWGRRYGAKPGPLAAALFVGGPIVVHLASIGYVEATLTLFVTAGFSCLDRWFLERRPLAGRSAGRLPGVALAAFFLGTACSVKYLGGYFAVSALLLVAVFSSRRLRDTAIFAVCCAAGALPTTLWLIVNTANPVFPFATGVFGTNAWTLATYPVPLETYVLRPIRLLWDVTFARGRVNFQPPFTPFLIPAAVLVLVAAWRSAHGRLAAALGVTYLVIFAFLPQDSRYLVPLLPLAAIAAAVALTKRWPNAPAWLALVVIAPGVAYIGYRLMKDGLPPATPAAREAVLTRRIPGYAALQRVNEETVYICGGEHLKYYALGRLLGDHNGPYSYDRILGPDPRNRDTAWIAANLRRIPATHYLVTRARCISPPQTGGMELVYEDATAQLWRVWSAEATPPL